MSRPDESPVCGLGVPKVRRLSQLVMATALHQNHSYHNIITFAQKSSWATSCVIIIETVPPLLNYHIQKNLNLLHIVNKYISVCKRFGLDKNIGRNMVYSEKSGRHKC